MQTNVMMVAWNVVLCFSPFGEPLYDVLNVSILIGQSIASPLWLKHTKENSLCLLNLLYSIVLWWCWELFLLGVFSRRWNSWKRPSKVKSFYPSLSVPRYEYAASPLLTLIILSFVTGLFLLFCLWWTCY